MMCNRLIQFLLSYAILTWCGPMVVAAPSLVANGGFEEGLSDQPAGWKWADPSPTLQHTWTKAGAHSGQRALHIRVPGELDTSVGWSLVCANPIPVEPGEYVAAFWLKAACDRLVFLSADGYDGEKLVKSRLGETAGAYCRRGVALGFGPCDWTRFEREFIVPAGVSSLRLTFYGKPGTDLTLDDVEIRRGKLPYRPQGQRVDGHASSRVVEKLDRGLVAARTADGVYVGWRLLREDPADVAFRVYRKTRDGRFALASASPITDTSDFVDTGASAAAAVGYRLCAIGKGGEEELATCEVETCDAGVACRTVPLRWPGRPPLPAAIEKIGIGDLDGDGRYDFVVKHPAGNVLLYDDYKKWKPSPATYKIDAFSADGKHLWHRDLGWSIENRNWFSPLLVYDLDGDGRAEVIAKVGEGDPRNQRGRVVDGAEWMAIWDGRTGEEIARASWPSRAGFDCYNFVSRNQLAVAYLDGRTPCLLALRGTYGLMKVDAYQLAGRQLRPLWKFCNADAPAKYWGQGAHFTQCVDVDGDGRDEIALGSMLLDDTGVPLWSTGKGHPDGLYIGDLDPGRPGLEMYTHIEYVCQSGGMTFVDAATGKVLWELATPTSHVHGGLCADFDPTVAGWECFGVDKKPVNGKDQIIGTWLKSAMGAALQAPTDWKYGKPTIYWDADLQKELISGRSIHKYLGASHWPIPAFAFVPVDLLSDWREELLEFTENGCLRIHFSTIPAMDRRACLMQDPIYRSDIAMCAMAYHRPAMLSYCPAGVAPNLSVTVQLVKGRWSCRIVISSPHGVRIDGTCSLSGDRVQFDPPSFPVHLAPGERVEVTSLIHAGATAPADYRIEASLRHAGGTLVNRQVFRTNE